MTGVRLVFHQVRYDLKAFLRNPAALFFTAILPVIFLVVFVAIFGNDTDEQRGIKLSTYYVPGILGLAVISATLLNLAISMTTLREDGVLKRMRGTPLPTWVLLAARVMQSFVVSAVLVVVLSVLGRVLYGVSLPTRTLPAFLVTLLVGAAAFSCLGLALFTFIPSEEAAPAITNAVILPLYFISGTFFPVENAPAWVSDLAGFFPVRHFGNALLNAFAPAVGSSGWSGPDLLNLVIWGVVAAAVAIRRFRWTPRSH